jgi:hypothetical protein
MMMMMMMSPALSALLLLTATGSAYDNSTTNSTQVPSYELFIEDLYPIKDTFDMMHFGSRIASSRQNIAVHSLVMKPTPKVNRSKVSNTISNSTESTVFVYHRRPLTSNTSSSWAWMETPPRLISPDKSLRNVFGSALAFIDNSVTHTNGTTSLIIGAAAIDKSVDGMVYVYTLVNESAGWNLTQSISSALYIFAKTGIEVRFKNFGSSLVTSDYGGALAIASYNEGVFLYTRDTEYSPFPYEYLIYSLMRQPCYIGGCI